MENREETLFEAARKLSDPRQRAAFLDAACQGQVGLRRRLDELLAAQLEADAFFEKGPESGGATVLLPVTEKPGDRIGRYRLLEQIGEGGCGVVYMAEQEEPVRRRVALKVIKLGMDTKQVVARFEAERQALAMMDHPNIAQVFDGGATDTGRPYFVLELVRGVRITDYCDQNHLATADRLKLFIQVCHAIQHAHQKGIIHRDIKPSNILVSLHDDVPVPKVIDFGIAKAMGERLTDKTFHTQFEQFMGTPAYMSPEQAGRSDLDIDTRSDIYALGVLLYELLAGRPPFDPRQLAEAGLEEMVRCIREEEPMRPSTRLSRLQQEELTTTAQRRGTESPKLIHLLRGDLDWIVMKCLEKNRTRRYEAANALALDIERHLNNEPVAARPPSAAYRVQKFVRRNKVMVTAGAAVLAAMVLGVVGSTWQAVRATRAEEKAEAALQKESAERLKAEQAQAREAEQRRLAVQAGEVAQRNLYMANMNLAQQAWEQSNIGRLRQTLEDTRESPHRGFEWYFWQQQTHLAVKTLRGHLDYVFRAAFSPDGQRIVTGSWDQTAKVWDAASGRELLTLKGHHARIHSVAFSPDGQRIVTGSWDQTAKVWDAANGRELLTLKGHREQVLAVAFSPDGQRIVTGSHDRTAKVWDATSGNLLRSLEGHRAAIVPVAFSPDGQRVVTGSGDRTARVWDVASGKQLLELKGHTSEVVAAFSPDGQRIATGSHDQTARVWDATSGQELFALRGHTGPINSIAYSLDGHRIVAGVDDNTARVWDAADGRELLTLKGHSGPVISAAFSPDGQRIVTGSMDQTARVWDAAGGLAADQTGEGNVKLKGHSNGISSVAFSPDGQRIVTGSWDQTAKVWDAASGKLLRSLEGHSTDIRSVAFSPDGHRILTGNGDKTARVWDAATGRPLLTLEGLTGGVNAVAFSPDGQRIVGGSDDILPGSDDCIAAVWDAVSGKQLLPLMGHTDGILSVAFSPDGLRIVTAGGDKTAKVWEAATGRVLFTLEGHRRVIWSVAFSPDGQRIVTASDDQTARLWEAATGRELLPPLEGHSDWVYSVAFSPDGHRIVTGSHDRTARVWEVASGRELLTLRAPGDSIRCVAFSPDGWRIVTGGNDGIAEVWEAARPEQVTAWQQEERAAAQSVDALRREQAAEEERERMVRARDSIKQWLLLVPIPLAPGQSGAEGLDLEQIPGESGLRPKEGEAGSIGGGGLKWRKVALTNEVLDFNAALGQGTTQSVAYAVCYLRPEAAQRGLQMLVGSDDQSKVYLNGKEIYKSSVDRPFYADQDAVPDIALNAGLNVLVFKVVNEVGGWAGSIRFTDAQGNPVQGIKVTLDPETIEGP
jgi:WD40 repeat protein